jgi:hypothetical protein
MVPFQQEKGDSFMTMYKPTEADARSLAQKLDAFAEGLEPGERVVLFKSLPKVPEESQDEVHGHLGETALGIGGGLRGGYPPPPGGQGGIGVFRTNLFLLYY